MESVKPQTKSAKSTKGTKKTLSVVGNESKSTPNKEERNTRIAISAYFKAQARGFEQGHEMADWLAAEAEVQ